jgi:hypothetical protein
MREMDEERRQMAAFVPASQPPRPAGAAQVAVRASIWHRLSRWLGTTVPDPTLDLPKGERHTFLGIAIAAGAWLGSMPFMFAMAKGVSFAAIGTVATYLLVGAGLLAGSRIARWVAFLYASLVVLGIPFFLYFADMFRRLFGTATYWAIIVGATLFAVGIGLATVSPWARDWQYARRHQLRARRERKATSLADWRGTEAES